MSNVHQAIRDAVEKGGYRYRWWKVNDLESNEGYNGLQLRALSEHFQDPDFWKALATARRWEDVNAWRFHWHRFIDHLADGKDAESFFASLWKKKRLTRDGSSSTTGVFIMIIRAVLLFLASTSVAIGETAILRAPDPEGAALLDFPGMRRAPSPDGGVLPNLPGMLKAPSPEAAERTA